MSDNKPGTEKLVDELHPNFPKQGSFNLPRGILSPVTPKSTRTLTASKTPTPVHQKLKRVQFLSEPVDLETMAQRMPTEADTSVPQAMPTTTPIPILKPPSPNKLLFEKSEATLEPKCSMDELKAMSDRLAKVDKADAAVRATSTDAFRKLVTEGFNVLMHLDFSSQDPSTFKNLYDVFHVYAFVNNGFQIMAQLSCTAEAQTVIAENLTQRFSIAVKQLTNARAVFHTHDENLFLSRLYIQITRFFTWVFNKPVLLKLCAHDATLDKMTLYVIDEYVASLVAFHTYKDKNPTKKPVTLCILKFFRELRIASCKLNADTFRAILTQLFRVSSSPSDSVTVLKLDIICEFIGMHPDHMAQTVELWFIPQVISVLLCETTDDEADKVWPAIGRVLTVCVSKYMLEEPCEVPFQAFLVNTTLLELKTQNANGAYAFRELLDIEKSRSLWDAVCAQLVYIQSFGGNYKYLMNVWESVCVLCVTFASPSAAATSKDLVLKSLWPSISNVCFEISNIKAKKQALVSRKTMAFVLFKILLGDSDPSEKSQCVELIFELNKPEWIPKLPESASLLLYYMQYLFKVARLASLCTYGTLFDCFGDVVTRLFDSFDQLSRAYPQEVEKIQKHQAALLQKLLQSPLRPTHDKMSLKDNFSPVTKLNQISSFNSLSDANTNVILDIVARLVCENPHVNYSSCIVALIARVRVSYENSVLLAKVLSPVFTSQAKSKEIGETLLEELVSKFGSSLVSPTTKTTVFSTILAGGACPSTLFQTLQPVTNKVSNELELQIFASLTSISPVFDTFIQNYYSTKLLPASLLPAELTLVTRIANTIPSENLIDTLLRIFKGDSSEIFRQIAYSKWTLELVLYFLTQYKRVISNVMGEDGVASLCQTFNEHPDWTWPILELIQKIYGNAGETTASLSQKSEIAFMTLSARNYKHDKSVIHSNIARLSELSPGTLMTSMKYLVDYKMGYLLSKCKLEIFKSLFYVKVETEATHRIFYRILSSVLGYIHKSKDMELFSQYLDLFNHVGYLSVVFSFLSLIDFDVSSLTLRVFAGLAYFYPDARDSTVRLLKDACYENVRVMIDEWVRLRSVYSFVMYMDAILKCYAAGEQAWNLSQKKYMLRNFNVVCYYVLHYAEITQYQTFVEQVLETFPVESSYHQELRYIALVQPGFKDARFKKARTSVKKYRKKHQSLFLCHTMRLGYEVTPTFMDFDTQKLFLTSKCAPKTVSELLQEVVQRETVKEEMEATNNASVSDEYDVIASSTQNATDPQVSVSTARSFAEDGGEHNTLSKEELHVSVESISEYSNTLSQASQKGNGIAHIVAKPSALIVSTPVVLHRNRTLQNPQKAEQSEIGTPTTVEKRYVVSNNSIHLDSTQPSTSTAVRSVAVAQETAEQEASTLHENVSVNNDYEEKEDMDVIADTPDVLLDKAVPESSAEAEQAQDPEGKAKPSGTRASVSDVLGAHLAADPIVLDTDQSAAETAPAEKKLDKHMLAKKQAVSATPIVSVPDVGASDGTRESSRKRKSNSKVPAAKKPKVSVLQTSQVRKIVAAMRRFPDSDLDALSDDEKARFRYELQRFIEKL